MPSPLAWARPSPPDLPLPPARMALLRGGRPLKRWRYVGAFGRRAHAVRRAARSGRAARVVGGVGRRAAARAHASPRRRGALRPGGHVRDRRDRPPRRRGRGRRVAHRTASSTSGRASRPAGRPRHGRRPRARGLAVVDDTAGYHARTRSGGGRPASARGRRARRLERRRRASTTASARALGLGRRPPREVAPVAFADDLSRRRRPALPRREPTRAPRPQPGAGLTTASRSARFSGTLPAGAPRWRGFGVMEHHRVRW